MSTIFLDIIERHADEAAFLWDRRDRAARSPLFDPASLADLDERLDANLEGLLVAGKAGLAASVAGLARARVSARGSSDAASPWRRSQVGGEIFTMTWVAAELRDPVALAKVLGSAEQSPAHGRAAVWALAWLSTETAAHTLSELTADDCPLRLFQLGIGAHALRRSDPGAALVRAIKSSDAALRSCAFRAAGELGRRDLLPMLRTEAAGMNSQHLVLSTPAVAGRTQGPEIVDPADRAHSWAVWAAAILGDAGAARSLWTIAERGGPDAARMCALAARCTPVSEAAERLHAMSLVEDRLEVALEGAMALGDPACLAWVLPLVARPALSRRAAWVYSTLTGTRLDAPLATRKPTIDPSATTIASDRADPTSDLPHPDAQALLKHWENTRGNFPSSERFLGGQRIDDAWLDQCLRGAVQPWRAAAAVEKVLRAGGGQVFPIRTRSRVQRAWR